MIEQTDKDLVIAQPLKEGLSQMIGLLEGAGDARIIL